MVNVRPSAALHSITPTSAVTAAAAAAAAGAAIISYHDNSGQRARATTSDCDSVV